MPVLRSSCLESSFTIILPLYADSGLLPSAFAYLALLAFYPIIIIVLVHSSFSYSGISAGTGNQLEENHLLPATGFLLNLLSDVDLKYFIKSKPDFLPCR